jgi:hypothetical protein
MDVRRRIVSIGVEAVGHHVPGTIVADRHVGGRGDRGDLVVGRVSRGIGRRGGEAKAGRGRAGSRNVAQDRLRETVAEVVVAPAQGRVGIRATSGRRRHPARQPVQVIVAIGPGAHHRIGHTDRVARPPGILTPTLVRLPHDLRFLTSLQ